METGTRSCSPVQPSHTDATQKVVRLDPFCAGTAATSDVAAGRMNPQQVPKVTSESSFMSCPPSEHIVSSPPAPSSRVSRSICPRIRGIGLSVGCALRQPRGELDYIKSK